MLARDTILIIRQVAVLRVSEYSSPHIIHRACTVDAISANYPKFHILTAHKKQPKEAETLY